ncbi:MAG TPA: C2H2-type zinc finger protein [Nitrososphaerales archaeon]|nr:C2H2-type zinc finger protein [Nitrososphaerales archaeon]
MAYSQTTRTISYAILGGLIGALAVGAIALMMPIPGTGGAPFFVAAAMLLGMGSMSWVAGWTLHLVAGLVIGAIFGVLLAKVSRLGLKTTGRALVLGGVAGLAAFVVSFIPMMTMLMPALMGMPTMVGGGLVAHAIFGLVLGGVTSLAIPKSSSSHQCPTCGASFETESELKEHGKLHMSSKPTQEFKCPACGATFATQQELREHNAKAHSM